MSKLLERIERTIVSRELLKRNARVLIGVSGGVDSMVLLHALHRLAPEFGWQLTVAHLNHRLRGRASDADARFVLRTAQELKIPAVHENADVKQLAARKKHSVEMAARELRHKFLAQTARHLKASIALAHHADDQLELFFVRLLRGSDEGLAGMQWKRPSPADPRITLVRPLLEIPKADLLAYAEEQGIRFREDASNASPEFLRNRIRLELLPLLKRDYQPGLNQVVGRVAEIAGGNSDFVTEAAEQWLAAATKRSAFHQLHVAVQRRCLQLQLIRLGVVPGFDLIERLRTQPERICIGSNRFVRLDSNGEIQLDESEPEVAPADSPVRLNLQFPGEVQFGGLNLAWEIGANRSRQLPVFRSGREVFDAVCVGSEVVLRRWQPGDRFQPIGMASAVKLQDLFTNARIPRAERSRLVIACTASGEIFWVERLRVSERFKVTSRTIRRLLWRWKPR